MVDNRYATALVIGSVLSLLATVYLSVAVGTQHWYQYNSPPVRHDWGNASQLREFINGETEEQTYSGTLYRLNGTLGLWWRCILVPEESHLYKWLGKTSAFHFSSLSKDKCLSLCVLPEISIRTSVYMFENVSFCNFRHKGGDAVCELHSSSAVQPKVQICCKPQRRRRCAENM